MFEDLRRAFREGIDNFNKELNRKHVPETVDKLIKGMVDEITDAKSGLGELENQIKKALIESEKEKGEAQTARRREQMANEIGDAETAMIAASFAEKHEQHQTVLEQKALALKAEFEFREAGIEEMMSKIKEAKTKRESISATAGRTGARESISAADDLFSELDRMSDKIDGEKAKGDAAEAFSEIDLGGTDSDTHIDMNGAPRSEPDFDAALEELKRRMGKE
ncbi:MAG: PspA/IM30 family protein [Longimicrobiales bacterium]